MIIMARNKISLCEAVDFSTKSSDDKDSVLYVEYNVCDVDFIATVWRDRSRGGVPVQLHQ